MTDRRAIRIDIEETHSSAHSVRVHAHVGAFHRTPAGLRMVPLQTRTQSMGRLYADTLTPGLMRALLEAVELVMRNYYESDELPFG